MQTGSIHGEQTPPSIRIVEEIAAREGVKPTDLDSVLYDNIDPDAIDSLFAGGADGRLCFTAFGYAVTVDTEGGVTVQER